MLNWGPPNTYNYDKFKLLGSTAFTCHVGINAVALLRDPPYSSYCQVLVMNTLLKGTQAQEGGHVQY